jgi:hypothetical protein
VSRSDRIPIIASRPFTSSVSGFHGPWTYPSSSGLAAVPRKTKDATAMESPMLSWNCALIGLPVMISSTTAEVKPIMAARPLTRSATARKSLGRSIFVKREPSLVARTTVRTLRDLTLFLDRMGVVMTGLRVAMQDILYFTKASFL